MRGELRSDVGILQAIAQLSPHGATLGHPRDASAALIEECEETPRGPYAGSVGVFADNGDFEVATVIRSLWIQAIRSRSRLGRRSSPARTPRPNMQSA